MERLVTFYIDQNLMVVKATIESNEFVTIELLYPFTGITADYYCDEGDFLSPELPFKIQEFSEQICTAYLDLATQHESFLKYVEHAKVVYPTETIEESIQRFLDVQFDLNLIREYFSSQSYDQLGDAYLHTLSSGPFILKNDYLHQGIEKQLRNALEAVVKSQVNEVVIFAYQELQNSHPKVVIDLSVEEIPEEKLLQELIINSPPAKDISEPADLWESQFLTERFNKFSDQKRLKLFMICNVKKDLFMYNKHLARWWMDRY